MKLGEISLEILEKFCPICKNKNERSAGVCKYCGASLQEYPTSAAATTRNTNDLSGVPVRIGEVPLDTLIPAEGIAIYVPGTVSPVFLSSKKEFIIGRKLEVTGTETILDLSDMNGFDMGISRRHATIRQVESGYEVMDLASTNGTWLNDERLVPNKPYPLANKSQLRVGRLRFLVLYRLVSPNPAKK